MGTQVTLDQDVVFALVEKSIELNMVFSPVNEVLRTILGITKERTDINSDNYPSSKFNKTQSLLDGLRDTIFSISKDGMKLHNNRKWVANPNVVTIIVQEPRAHNLRITVYGRPTEFDDIFGGVKSLLDIKDDMSGYSRFVLKDESQLPYTIKVIQHSYKLKKDRGRL